MASEIRAVMAASVWKVLVRPGDSVAQGQDVVILESMKMEIPVASQWSGTVIAVTCAEGEFVDEGKALVTLE